MSTFVPDPNLVVEALKHIRDNGSGANWDSERAQELARNVLPHAEAIAEMFERTELSWRYDPNVQELIAAARPFALDFNDDTRRLRAALEAMSA